MTDARDISILVTLICSIDADDTLHSLIAEVEAVDGSSAHMLEEPEAPLGSKAAGLPLAAFLLDLASKAVPSAIQTIGEWLSRQPPDTVISIKDGDFEFKWSGPTPPDEVNALMRRLVAQRRR